MSTLKWTRAHFSLHISVDLDGRGQREVKWANFVQPKSGLNDKTSTELGPVKQADGGSFKQAQEAHFGDLTQQKSQGLSQHCESGEVSGLPVSIEKSNLGSGEMGEEF